VRWVRLIGAVLVVAAATVTLEVPPSAPATDPDPAQGQTLSIVPPGNNGLVNVGQLVAFEAHGTRPANSNDQYKAYEDLPYNADLTESELSDYYRPETFDLPADEVARVETPSTSVPVTITWDTSGVPHIKGQTFAAAAFGVGYAQAEDRLFEMDVLRHYGAGTLSSFVGPSCSDESMDASTLRFGATTPAQRQAQINALPAEYPQGGLGEQVVSLIDNYVAGVNAYITATRTNVNLLPADYLAIGKLPQPWVPGDVVAVGSLIGAQLGAGGGGAMGDAALLEYLQGRYGSSTANQIFSAFKEQNDPGAPTTITNQTFPYMQTSTPNPTLNVLPDNAGGPLLGAIPSTTPGCNISLSSPTSLLPELKPYIDSLPPQVGTLLLASMPSIESSVNGLVTSLQGGLNFPTSDSNALVVDGAHTTTGHPIAVFGPQVGYWSPEILLQEVIQAPGVAADGVSFPGTGLVELGRGLDYAWSATSAGAQNVDTRVVTVCNPNGIGAPPSAQGTYYLLDGACVPMQKETFTETATPTPGGLGLPVVLTDDIYLADGGIVQGWTTADGQPIAVVQERSNFLHDIDSAVGFLRFDSYADTTDVTTWMQAASQISYTFNWFYVDSTNAGYFQSGGDPQRPSDVDANFPMTDAPAAAWQGMIPASAHPHEVNPPQGFFTSWNNKPAPGFSASNSEFGYGDVYRSQLLDNNLRLQLYVHKGKVDRSEVVSAMAAAATQDLDAVEDWPALLSALPHPANGDDQALLSQLSSWVMSGAHRIQAVPGIGQYTHASAIAISDELYPRLVVALFGPIFDGEGVSTEAGGVATQFKAFPQLGFVNAPGSLGSAYDGGFEGNVQKLLDQMAGIHVADPYPPTVLNLVCGPGGISDCTAAIESALAGTWSALVKANGGSTNPATWTADSYSAAKGASIPQLDSISYTTVGVVGEPNMPWQNRPTFQQVAEFPSSRQGG
jgi:acyl-homoserine lactone acylase PvdQ